MAHGKPAHDKPARLGSQMREYGVANAPAWGRKFGRLGEFGNGAPNGSTARLTAHRLGRGRVRYQMPTRLASQLTAWVGNGSAMGRKSADRLPLTADSLTANTPPSLRSFGGCGAQMHPPTSALAPLARPPNTPKKS